MAYQYNAVGGSDIQVVLEFPTILINGQPGILEMASAISVSYSVYRAKSNVYNMGQPILNGLAVGRKYVAGSIITVSWQIDEISNFINQYVNSNTANPQVTSDASYKDIRTVMRDDLTPFNIYFLMSDEYTGQAGASKIIVYGAQFINNGQVMSINDIITENTLSFIAQDVQEQQPLTQTNTYLNAGNTMGTAITASSLLNG